MKSWAPDALTEMPHEGLHEWFTLLINPPCWTWREAETWEAWEWFAFNSFSMTPTITISPIENDFVENTPSPRPGVAFNSYPIAKRWSLKGLPSSIYYFLAMSISPYSFIQFFLKIKILPFFLSKFPAWSYCAELKTLLVFIRFLFFSWCVWSDSFRTCLNQSSVLVIKA